jgi:hypothetical protein
MSPAVDLFGEYHAGIGSVDRDLRFESGVSVLE